MRSNSPVSQSSIGLQTRWDIYYLNPSFKTVCHCMWHCSDIFPHITNAPRLRNKHIWQFRSTDAWKMIPPPMMSFVGPVIVRRDTTAWVDASVDVLPLICFPQIIIIITMTICLISDVPCHWWKGLPSLCTWTYETRSSAVANSKPFYWAVTQAEGDHPVR